MIVLRRQELPRKRMRRLAAMFPRPLFVSALVVLFSASAVFGQAPPGPQAAPEPGSPALAALQKARQSVEKFFEQSANVVCTENVSQMILGKNGKQAYREESLFDYQLQANPGSGSLRLVETRETRKAAFRDSSRTLLITNGFTSMLLIVHPTYEASYSFEPAGEESVDGTAYVKIHFQAIPGTSSPAALQLRGKNYPIPLSGMMWIDKQTGAISKLVASVDASLSDLGLQSMRSEIHYATVHFHDPEEFYWMPMSAIIDVETPRQRWRNVHRFTQYKRFKATIEVEDRQGNQP